VRGGDDGAEGVERGTTKEDIIRCGCVNDKEADEDDFSLGSVTEDSVKVNVAAGGNLFSTKAINWFIIQDHGTVWELEISVSCPVEDVNGAVLVDKDFLDCIVFYFNSDGVVLLVIEVVEVIVRKSDGRHAASVMGMGNMVDGLDMAEVFLSGRRGGSSTSETTRDGVNSVA